MNNENQNWLHDLFINEAKAAKDYHNRGGEGGGGTYAEEENEYGTTIVLGGADLQEKTIDITQNGEVVIEPDEGYALKKVTANVDVKSESVEWINDGNTHIWIHLEEGRTSPILGVCPNGTVTVDWGDGTTPDVLTGTSVTTVKYTPTHDYASAGDYIITLTVDGEMGFGYASNNSTLLIHPNKNNDQSMTYRNAIRKVEVANGIIGNYSFYHSHNLTNVLIPDSVTKLGVYAFGYCYSLTDVVIPDGVTAISSSAFAYCYSLTNVLIPDSVTSFGDSAFSNCSLAKIVIPDGVTTISGSAFSNCYGLTSIVIPSSVASIGSNAFVACYGIAKIRFEGATPPTLGSSGALRLSTDCIISVPVGCLEAYTTATNYPSATTYTYVEE